MTQSSMLQFLASVIDETLSEGESDGERTRGSSPPLSSQAQAVALELVEQAIASGMPLTHAQTEHVPLGGGNTAEVVARLTLHAPFALKLDSKQSKLASEGALMRRVRNDLRLPERFRNAWPTVYALREQAPYAYLMEYFPKDEGWLSLEDRLFPGQGTLAPSPIEVSRMIQTVLDVLFAGFDASVDVRALPSLREDYIKRIRERLTAAAALDDRFAPRALTVNGARLKPWHEYLELLEDHPAFIDSITPRFSTVTHGDPNPGNLVLRTSATGVELKLIDPKDWFTGDYLFDIAKITHFVDVTGPLEKPATGAPAAAEFARQGDATRLDYAFDRPAWTAPIVDACLDRVKLFATIHHDLEWQARYELGMASNLLGLPVGRLTALRQPRPDAALVLYAEGLKWLDKFCERLSGARPAPCEQTPVLTHTEVEPIALQRVRELVRAHAPGVRANEDRRGFQALEWPPARANDAGKPAQLSLEHEARLLPSSQPVLERLVEALYLSEGKALGESLLPPGSEFAELVVRRYARAPGAQSVDRYYDVEPLTARGLIAKTITVRERIKTSDFMTWSSTSSHQAPLNLELPFTALNEVGVIARLEFNWIDVLETSLREACQSNARGRWENPIYIATQAINVSFEGVRPILEHTTFREKFGIWERSAGGAAERLAFDLNIDHVVAQCLKSHRVGQYVDVDISSHALVDAAELTRLAAFATAVATRYGLLANFSTKALRDARTVGLL